jgi:hypothetical protein
MIKVGDLVDLPEPVADIYRAVAKLTEKYKRPFTPDGHLIGSIGEVIAMEALDLELCPPSTRGYDATCQARGQVQIKITARKGIAMRGPCNHLIVFQIVPPDKAKLVYDGPGKDLWGSAGPTRANGQRQVSLSKLERLQAGQ